MPVELVTDHRPTDGPSVLLVHGLSSNGASWGRVRDQLDEAGIGSITVDLRGHGSSPRGAAYRFADHVDDLLALDLRADLVVGHSLAGPIVSAWAAASGRPGPLLLLDPVFELDDGSFADVVADQVAEIDPATTADEWLRANPRWDRVDAEQKVAGARATTAAIVAACLEHNAPYHHLDLLAAVPGPVTIAAADPTVGVMCAAETVSPWAEVVVFDGCGHSLHRDDPGRVAALIGRLVADQGSG